VLKRLLGAQWVAIGFVGAVSFLLSVAIARRFGPEAFGVYAQAVSLGAFLLILIDGGFGKLLMRETARESPALVGHGENLHAFAFGHAYFVMAILALLVVLNPFSLHRPTLLATVGAFGVAVLGQFSLAILRGHGRLVRDALWQMLSRLLTASCMALALYWGASAPWQVLGAQFLGGLLVVLVLLRRGWVKPVFRVPRQVYATIIPLVWIDLATVVYFRSDMLLFKFADVAKADVGAYGVAFRLIEAFLLLASPVSLLLFRRFRRNEALMGREALLQVVRLAAIASGLGVVIFLVSWPVADVVFRVVFGEEFALAGSLFKVLCLMLVFALANGVFGQAVFALGLDRYYAWTATAAAAFNVAGNLLLMPTYGVWAAAWMTVATELVLATGLLTALFGAWRTRRHGGST
jgi:O-antigen/teichoic acid export membrane protein